MSRFLYFGHVGRFHVKVLIKKSYITFHLHLYLSKSSLGLDHAVSFITSERRRFIPSRSEHVSALVHISFCLVPLLTTEFHNRWCPPLTVTALHTNEMSKVRYKMTSFLFVKCLWSFR